MGSASPSTSALVFLAGIALVVVGIAVFTGKLRSTSRRQGIFGAGLGCVPIGGGCIVAGLTTWLRYEPKLRHAQRILPTPIALVVVALFAMGCCYFLVYYFGRLSDRWLPPPQRAPINR